MSYFDILIPCEANGVSQYSMFMKTSRDHVLNMCRSFAFDHILRSKTSVLQLPPVRQCLENLQLGFRLIFPLFILF
jgi:hypothetical protein